MTAGFIIKQFLCFFVPVLAAIFLLSYILSMRWIKIKHEKVYFKDIPGCYKGIKILHLSDIHNASYKKASLNIIKKIEDIEFDIAVITGDMTRKNIKQIYPLKEQLLCLSKKSDTFFVSGNHEYYDYDEVKDFMESLGIEVLSNELSYFEINGGKVCILGLRDLAYNKKDGFREFDKVFKQSADDKFRIVLVHQPHIFERISLYGKQLVLSGHTHGGQLRLPFIKTIFAPGQGFFPKYGDGWYEENSSKMFISKGLGTTIFPVRLFNRPEIAVIELLC